VATRRSLDSGFIDAQSNRALPQGVIADSMQPGRSGRLAGALGRRTYPRFDRKLDVAGARACPAEARFDAVYTR